MVGFVVDGHICIRVPVCILILPTISLSLSLSLTHTHTLSLSLTLSQSMYSLPSSYPLPLLSLSFPIFLSRLLSESCQKVLFSATYSDEVMSFAKQVVPDPIVIRLKRSEESLDNIKQVIEVHVHTQTCI